MFFNEHTLTILYLYFSPPLADSTTWSTLLAYSFMQIQTSLLLITWNEFRPSQVKINAQMLRY